MRLHRIDVQIFSIVYEHQSAAQLWFFPITPRTIDSLLSQLPNTIFEWTALENMIFHQTIEERLDCVSDQRALLYDTANCYTYTQCNRAHASNVDKTQQTKREHEKNKKINKKQPHDARHSYTITNRQRAFAFARSATSYLLRANWIQVNWIGCKYIRLTVRRTHSPANWKDNFHGFFHDDLIKKSQRTTGVNADDGRGSALRFVGMSITYTHNARTAEWVGEWDSGKLTLNGLKNVIIKIGVSVSDVCVIYFRLLVGVQEDWHQTVCDMMIWALIRIGRAVKCEVGMTFCN